MKAPKCRLCGKLHWGVCGSIVLFGDEAEVVIKQQREAMKSIVSDRIPVLKKGAVEVCPHCGKGLGEPVSVGFDKRAYQREYMRKRRASV